MNKLIKNKLASLPSLPGVYFHKNSNGEIIYIGKAANLKNRVRQYFQASRYRDPKTDLLVSEINDVDWTVLTSEAEALFLEAELVKRYLPKYNILLRDDKSSVYIRINIKDYAPSVNITRRPLDDGANYYGPFLQSGAVNKALRSLRKAFPYSTHTTLPSRACLQYHLGLCPGPESLTYNRELYLANLKKLILFIEGKSQKVVKVLEKEMQVAAKRHNYELAADLRNKLNAIKAMRVQIIFGDNEFLDLSKDHALYDLTKLLGLKKPPHRIEGYDISHLQGTDTVASMVVFANGTPSKKDYRKFKMRLKGNNDYAHIKEVILRRMQANNIKAWGKPDLILIDGGKGQLSSAIEATKKADQKIPIIGLAKNYEELIINNASLVKINYQHIKKLKGRATESSKDFTIINLPASSHIIKLLQRIRDESHRFAVSYHSTIKIKRQSASMLDDIPGIGPATKKKLLKHFGSLKALRNQSQDELSRVVGKNKAQLLYANLLKSGNE